MSWSVHARMVRKEKDGLFHVVLNDWFDELKPLCGNRTSDGFDTDLCYWSSAYELKMPDEARALFEISHPADENGNHFPEYTEKWVYYTRSDCETIKKKAEEEYQKWFLRMSKIQEYVDSKEYMILNSEQKESVLEELNAAKEMFDDDCHSARQRFESACALEGFWWRYTEFDGEETWLGIHIE